LPVAEYAVWTATKKKPARLPYTLEINQFVDGKMIELVRPKVPIITKEKASILLSDVESWWVRDKTLRAIN